MPLSKPELVELLAKLDEVVQQARELSAQIRTRMEGERRRDYAVSDWSDRREKPERRKRK